RLGAGGRISGTGICPYFATLSYVFPSQRLITASMASHSLAAYSATTSNTGCKSVGELAMTRRISLVAVCCSNASVRSRLRFSNQKTSHTVRRAHRGGAESRHGVLVRRGGKAPPQKGRGKKHPTLPLGRGGGPPKKAPPPPMDPRIGKSFCARTSGMWSAPCS